jgi:hypothetical protein
MRSLNDCAREGLSPELLRHAAQQALRRGLVTKAELGDVEAADREAKLMPVDTAVQRFQSDAMEWLSDFVAGRDDPLDPVRAAAAAIDDPVERLEAEVEVALCEARVAVARRGDWVTPAAALRGRLGDEPSRLIWRLGWRPAFRTMLTAATIGVVLFWVVRSIG